MKGMDRRHVVEHIHRMPSTCGRRVITEKQMCATSLGEPLSPTAGTPCLGGAHGSHRELNPAVLHLQQ